MIINQRPTLRARVRCTSHWILLSPPGTVWYVYHLLLGAITVFPELVLGLLAKKENPLYFKRKFSFFLHKEAHCVTRFEARGMRKVNVDIISSCSTIRVLCHQPTVPLRDRVKTPRKLVAAAHVLNRHKGSLYSMLIKSTLLWIMMTPNTLVFICTIIICLYKFENAH